ncbi:MAG: 3'-5' exoribonuclease YhaM family protein [Bacteriovoracaceae bacterium]
MSRISVSALHLKEELSSSFLVKHIAVQESRDGKAYLNVILADGTGEIEARLWNNAQATADSVAKGDFVQVSGKLNLYQGKKQFILSAIEKISAQTVNSDDYMMKAKENPEIMLERLLTIVNQLEDVYIKELLLMTLHDAEISRRLKTWQAGKTIHHAYQSGLLEHILSCTELALKLAPHYQVNVSYVVAGCVLHDLCKIYELSNGHNVDYTEEGKLVGHLTKGLEIVDRFSYKIRHFPYEMKMHLKHILLSHHGEYEYGSPKIPQTSEAYLVHLIDLMDSKMNSMEMVKRTDNHTGHWSGFVKHLDRIVYKDSLPTFSKFLDAEPEKENIQTSVKAETRHENKSRRNEAPPLKQNLGKMLEGLKIDK